MERRMIVNTGEYGLWKLDYFFNKEINSEPYYKRIHSETHFKKINKFIINIDRKHGLYKVIVDFRKNFKYTLKKGTEVVCVSDKLSIINNCK